MKNFENLETYALAAYGLARGLFEEFNNLPAGNKAWLGILGSVAVYEALAPKGELLSETVDRAIQAHPIATRVAIGYTALHLGGGLPKRLDAFNGLARLLGK